MRLCKKIYNRLMQIYCIFCQQLITSSTNPRLIDADQQCKLRVWKFSANVFCLRNQSFRLIGWRMWDFRYIRFSENRKLWIFHFFLKIERRDDYGNSEKRYLLCQSSNIIESKYSELVFIYWANEKCYLTRLNIKLLGTFYKLPLNLCNACFLTKTIKIFWQEFNQKHFLLEVWLWVFILFSGSSTLVSRGFSQ